MGCWLVWIMQPEWFLFMEVTIFSTFFWGLSTHGSHLLSRYHSAKRLIRPAMNLHLHWRFIIQNLLSHIRFSNGFVEKLDTASQILMVYRHFIDIFPIEIGHGPVVNSSMISIPFISIHHKHHIHFKISWLSLMVFIRFSPGLHEFSPWFLLQMRRSEQLVKNFRSKSFANRAAEALAFCHHFFWKISGKRWGKSMDFTYETWGKMAFFFSPGIR